MTKPAAKRPRADDDGGVELRTGRTTKAPWTDAHDWVGLADGVSPAAHSLYVRLKIHVNVELRQLNGDEPARPSKYSLAEMMGYDKVDTLDPYLDQLKRVGAIDVVRVGMPAKNFYYINDLPADAYCTMSDYPIGNDGRCQPHGGEDDLCEGRPYDGPMTIKAWYKRHEDAISARKAAAKASRDARRDRQRNRRAAANPQASPDTPSSGYQGELALDTPSSGYQDTPQGGHHDTPVEGVHDTPSTGREQRRSEQLRSEQLRTGGAPPPEPPGPQSPSAPGIGNPTSTSEGADVERDVIGNLRPRARGETGPEPAAAHPDTARNGPQIGPQRRRSRVGQPPGSFAPPGSVVAPAAR